MFTLHDHPLSRPVKKNIHVHVSLQERQLLQALFLLRNINILLNSFHRDVFNSGAQLRLINPLFHRYLLETNHQFVNKNLSFLSLYTYILNILIFKQMQCSKSYIVFIFLSVSVYFFTLIDWYPWHYFHLNYTLLNKCYSVLFFIHRSWITWNVSYAQAYKSCVLSY